MKIYEQLKALSLPIIESYHDDLIKHDLNSLTRYPGIPFLHFTGTTGTHLVIMHPADNDRFPPPGEQVPYLFGTADRNHILEGKVITVECMGKSWRQDLILHYDGNRLRKVSHEKSLEIVKTYANAVLYKWEGRKKYAGVA